MKKSISFVLLLSSVLFICCTSEVKDPVNDLKFESVQWSDDLIFIPNMKEYCNKIYCIDTSNDKKVYTYNFNPYEITIFLSDTKISNNIYLQIDYKKKLYVLQPEIGKLSSFNLKYPFLDLTLFGKKILLVRNAVSFKGNSIEYEIFNPDNLKTDIWINQDGGFTTHIDMNMTFNNKKYIPLGYDNEGNVGNTHPTVLNITDNKIIDFFPEKNYIFFHFVGQGYLFAYKYNSDKALISDVYKVNGFDPVDVQIMYTNTVVDRQDQTTGLRIFEDNDYLYVIDQTVRCLRITKRNKTDYDVVAQKEITRTFIGGTIPYFRNNHFWVVSIEDEGAYKISKDLEITVVK